MNRTEFETGLQRNYCSELNESELGQSESTLDTYREWMAILLPLWITIEAGAFMVNFLHLAAIIRKLYFRRGTSKRYLLEINRCASDLITTGSVVVMLVLQSAVFRASVPFRFQDTTRTLLALICFSIVSAWTLTFTYVAAAAEQYVAIAYPIFYRTKVTYRRCLLAIAIDWTLALFVGVVAGIALEQNSCGEGCTDSIVSVQLVLLLIVVPSTLTAFALTFRALKRFRHRFQTRHSSEPDPQAGRRHRNRMLVLAYQVTAFSFTFIPVIIVLIVYRQAVTNVLQFIKIDSYCSAQKKILDVGLTADYAQLLLVAWISCIICCIRAILDPIVACVIETRRGLTTGSTRR